MLKINKLKLIPIRCYLCSFFVFGELFWKNEDERVATQEKALKDNYTLFLGIIAAAAAAAL